MCQHRIIDCNKYIILVQDVDSGGMHVRTKGTWEFCSLYSVLEPEDTLKKKKKKLIEKILNKDQIVTLYTNKILENTPLDLHKRKC